jgi:Tol biopolymer transport system component
VADDRNGLTDIFLYDLKSHTTKRISVGTGGVESDGLSRAPVISADGRYVAFESDATNLVDGDTNGARDVFVCDTTTDTIQRVSVRSNGAQGDSYSGAAAISSDGRYIAFESFAGTLVPDDTNGRLDVFYHDTLTSQTARASVNTDGVEGNGDSRRPAISGQGYMIAFESTSTNLDAADLSPTHDVFVHDIRNGQTRLVSKSTSETGGNKASLNAAISISGRYVAFDSAASNLVSDDANGVSDVFVFNLETDELVRASTNPEGDAGDGASERPVLSVTGELVSFQSESTNLVGDDTNNLTDIYLRNWRN